MHRTRIKFCGMCRVQDAIAAAESGADAIGMVFYPPARRYVPPERAREIMAALPGFVTPVGLFVNADTVSIRHLTDALRLFCVQLHGDETPEQVAELHDLSVLKAIRVTPQTLQGELDRWRKAIHDLPLSNLKGLILETGKTEQAGGTGIENDWELIAKARQQGWFDNLPPIIATGGLSPENVANIVRLLHPYAVDVSSGIESQIGHKSAEKMKQFAAQVRLADRSH